MRLNDEIRQTVFDFGTLSVAQNGSGGIDDIIPSGLNFVRGLNPAQYNKLAEKLAYDAKFNAMVENWERNELRFE